MDEQRIQARLAHLALPKWEVLPDFGLYMDQLVTYVERCSPEDAPPLTPAMINNYVKCGLIDRPVGKKYSRESLAQLLMVCRLKQMASLETMKRLLHPLDGAETEAMYRTFGQVQERVRASFATLPTVDPLACALEAATYQTICRLLLEKED